MLKKKILRGSNSPFTTKTLRKAIIIRSRLKNRFNKTISDENWTLYKTQNTKLLRKTKKYYFLKVKPKLVSDNINFWQTIKPYFSDKGNLSNKTMISEKDYIVSDDRRLSGIFNTHFINITKTLDLKPSLFLLIKVFPKLLKLLKSS